MQRCENPECGKIIKKDVIPALVGSKRFCLTECAQQWLVQSKVFEVAAHPFHTPQRAGHQHRNGG